MGLLKLVLVFGVFVLMCFINDRGNYCPAQDTNFEDANRNRLIGGENWIKMYAFPDLG
jgi:hypothetical protein